MNQKRALVIFSGGQDSTTCLLWARRRFDKVETLNFFYGQRHSIERECAKRIARELNVNHSEVDISFLQALSTNSLTSETEIVLNGTFKNLPSTFVIGRNALFLTVAAAWGLARGYEDYVFGACEVDYSGYPDCRQKFIDSQAQTLSLATDSQVTIHTPLMKLSKADTFRLAEELGGLELVREQTHTCYLGERGVLHEWGYGCGTCPACVLRSKGYAEFKESHGDSRR